MRRQTGDIIAKFWHSRPDVTMEVKYTLLRFYLSVAVFRMGVAEQNDEIQKITELSEWEAQTHNIYDCWPWGERIFTEEVEILISSDTFVSLSLCRVIRRLLA